MPVESSQGRGATRNSTPTRFNLKERVADGEWLEQVEALDGVAPRRTKVTIEHPRSILTRNSSPDIPFDRSLNAYRQRSVSLADRMQASNAQCCSRAEAARPGLLPNPALPQQPPAGFDVAFHWLCLPTSSVVVPWTRVRTTHVKHCIVDWCGFHRTFTH